MKSISILVAILFVFRTGYSSDNGNKATIVEITYIANEGFLIKVGDKKVLVDALFGDKDYGFCDIPTEPTMNLILKNKNCFKDIDIIAATHSHPDHFFAPYVIDHLMNNTEGQFISCNQSINALKKQNDYEKIKNKLVEITPDNLSYIDTTINSIGVRVYRLAHGPYYSDDPLTGKKINRHQNIENVAFLFNINGIKIFHSGDSDENGIEEYDYFRLNEENIDIAFLGRGFIWKPDCKGIGLVKNNIKAKHIVLMHIHHDEYNEFYEVISQLKNEIENIKIFHNELEINTYVFE